MTTDGQNLARQDAAPAGSPAPQVLGYERAIMTRPTALTTWVWFIVKNVLGWTLILAAPTLGFFTPGPLGFLFFLLGFALVTFPGKRRLTARFLLGRPIAADSRAFGRVVAGLAGVLPIAVLWFLAYQGYMPDKDTPGRSAIWGGAYVVLALVLWWIGLHSLPLVNKTLRGVAILRRKVRPPLRRRGIDLLPRRRRRRRIYGGQEITTDPDPEIIHIAERHVTRMAGWWQHAKPWLRRALVLSVTAMIFISILEPVVEKWPLVRERVLQTRWPRFLLAAAAFAVFLFGFRAMSWRFILARFGHKLPIPAATRIWSTSELARYLPGVIWQVVGRVYLVKPYGVRGSVCSASQILELAIFLMANLLVAVCCLLWHGIRHVDGMAESWLYAAVVMVPVLAFALHPNVLFKLINGIMRRLGKPEIPRRMNFEQLAGLLLWNVVGVLLQCLAIWYIISTPLGLAASKWWLVAGAYCLAWCAGFLAFWAPGGLGVRELVFVAAMGVGLPPAVRQALENDPMAMSGLLAYLAVLLRLWATCGEIILASVAYVLDFQGAMRTAAWRPPPRKVAATSPLLAPPPPSPASANSPGTDSLVAATAER